MLRILLIFTAFSLAVAGLVFVQTTVVPAPGGDLELSNVANVAASLPAPSEAAAVPPTPQPAAFTPDETSEPDEMALLTASVLSGLGAEPSLPLATAAAGVAPGDAAMQDLTSQVLANLGLPAQVAPASGVNTTTPAKADPNAGSSMLTWLITNAIAEGHDEAYLDKLINDAAKNGGLAVPDSLRTSDGRVDTRTLIRQITQSASGEGAADPAQIAIGGPGVEVRVVQESGETVQHHFYTVQKGDSLGAIAQAFYGDAARYKQIFEANRRILSSPNLIKTGQRLTIPG